MRRGPRDVTRDGWTLRPLSRRARRSRGVKHVGIGFHNTAAQVGHAAREPSAGSGACQNDTEGGGRYSRAKSRRWPKAKLPRVTGGWGPGTATGRLPAVAGRAAAQGFTSAWSRDPASVRAASLSRAMNWAAAADWPPTIWAWAPPGTATDNVTKAANAKSAAEPVIGRGRGGACISTALSSFCTPGVKPSALERPTEHPSGTPRARNGAEMAPAARKGVFLMVARQSPRIGAMRHFHTFVGVGLILATWPLQARPQPTDASIKRAQQRLELNQRISEAQTAALTASTDHVAALASVKTEQQRYDAALALVLASLEEDPEAQAAKQALATADAQSAAAQALVAAAQAAFQDSAGRDRRPGMVRKLRTMTASQRRLTKNLEKLTVLYEQNTKHSQVGSGASREAKIRASNRFLRATSQKRQIEKDERTLEQLQASLADLAREFKPLDEALDSAKLKAADTAPVARRARFRARAVDTRLREQAQQTPEVAALALVRISAQRKATEISQRVLTQLRQEDPSYAAMVTQRDALQAR